VDYLIAGLASGAVLAIIGFLLSELGGSQRRSFPRWLPEAGAALMVAGLIVWAVTAAAFFAGPDDDTSLQVVTGSVVVAALGALAVATVMAWSHRRPAGLPATRQAAAQAVPAETDDGGDETGETVEAVGEPEGVEPAASDQGESESDVESGAEPVVEKNWEEIWRQTWGSVAVAQAGVAADDEADASESGKNELGPAGAEVLERWEAPEEVIQVAPGESQEGGAVDTLDPEDADDAGKDEPAAPADEASLSEGDEQPGTVGETSAEDDVPDATTAQRDEATYPESSLNGSDPETEIDVPSTAADVSRTRDQP
jgi:hypothetical protein